MKKNLLTLVCSLFFSTFLLSQAEKVADLSFSSSFVKDAVNVNDKIFFTHTTSRKLWVTDGTEAGTQVVPGDALLHWYKTFGDKLFYMDGARLYEVDSETLETKNLVFFTKDILNFAIYEDRIICITRGNTSQNIPFEVWHYDRITEERELIFQSVESISTPIKFNGATLFSVNSNIWTTDGTSGGTMILYEDNSGLVESFNLSNGITYNGEYYFTLKHDEYGEELWKTNGMSGGTTLVKDINLASHPISGTLSSLPENFRIKDGLLYFTAYTDFVNNRLALYQTDGTEINTKIAVALEKDFRLGRILDFMLFDDNTFLLNAYNPEYGIEWWKSDGTPEGTNILKDVWKGAGGMRAFFSGNTNSKVGDKLFFSAVDDEYGEELWRTDGTEAGTELVLDMAPGFDWSDIYVLPGIGDDVFFLEGDRDRGVALWKLNIEAEPVTPVIIEKNYDWFTSMGTSYDATANTIWTYVDALGIDEFGNTYISGEYDNRYLSFFDSNNALESRYSVEAFRKNFIASFDKDGNYRWSQQIGGESFATRQMLTTDKENHVIIASAYDENGLFGDEIEESNSRMYVVKMDEDGNIIWRENAFIGRYEKGEVNQIVTDQESNIIVGGCFADFSARFGSFQLSSEVSPAYFLTKYDKDGNVQWANRMPYNSIDAHGSVKSITVDEDGRIYVLASEGGYNWTVSCKYRPFEVRLYAYEPDGTLIWDKTWISDDFTFVTDAKISPEGIIHITGMFRGNFEIENQTLSTSCEAQTCFLLKVNQHGKLLKAIDFPEDRFYSYDLEFGKNNSYYLAGRQVLEEVPEYDYNNYQNLRSKIFVKKYNKHDELIDERLLSKGHSDSWDSNPMIVLDENERIILADTYSWGLDTISNALFSGNQQTYLMKFALEAEAVYPTEEELAEDEVLLYPNPANNYLRLFSQDEDFQNARLSLFDATGRLLAADLESYNIGLTEIDISGLSPGMYFLSIESDRDRLIKSFVKY